MLCNKWWDVRWAQSVTVRYLEVKEGVCHPLERLIDVFTTGDWGDTSVESLCDSLVSSLNKTNVNLDFIIGQSYNGVVGYAWKIFGPTIMNVAACQKSAVCVVSCWCLAHNLVTELMLGCCTDIRKALGVMQQLYNFLKVTEDMPFW